MLQLLWGELRSATLPKPEVIALEKAPVHEVDSESWTSSDSPSLGALVLCLYLE